MGLALLGAVDLAMAEVAVIANPSISADGISVADVERVFLGKTRELPGAVAVIPVDQGPGAPAREQFYAEVVEMTPYELNAYWARKIFNGKAERPRTLDDDAAVLDWVAKTPGAVGYVQASQVDDRVRVLLRAP